MPNDHRDPRATAPEPAEAAPGPTPACCPNCSADLALDAALAFCPSCGQEQPRGRLTVRGVSGDFVSNLVGWDSALRRTLKALFVDPGVMAAEYVAGRRRAYVNPARFCLLALGLWILFAARIQDDVLATLGIKITDSGGERDQVAEVVDAMRAFLTSNIDILLYLSLPIFGLNLRLLFRRSGRNLAECLVLALYLMGLRFVLSLICLPLAFLHPSLADVPRLLVHVFLSWRACRTFFATGSFAAAWRLFVALLLYFTLLVVFFIAIAGIWVIYVQGVGAE